MIGKTIDEVYVGQTESFTKTISESDVYNFAGVTGDMNPIHINQPYAEKTYFKDRIVHGMLGVSLISGVLGMKLPGPGTIFISTDIQFIAPVYIGDTLTAKVEIIDIEKDKNNIFFKAYCENQNGIVVIEGGAKVKAPIATVTHKEVKV